MTIRMSYEMRRAQNAVMGHPRVMSTDHRQVKRQMRRMLNKALPCAIASNLFVDWSLVVMYRQDVINARRIAKQNMAWAASCKRTVGALEVPTAGGGVLRFKTYPK